MKSIFKLSGLLGLLLIGFWIYRAELIMLLAEQALQDNNVVDYQPINWERAPDSGRPRSADSRPNIILIMADDLGVNDITAGGGGFANGIVPTPNIDRLAEEGIRFTHGYTGSGTCAPSRAITLTGRYPARTGFQFTPAPRVMGAMVSMISGQRDEEFAPMKWHPAAAMKLPSFEKQGLPGREVTIAEELKKLGYHTVHIGKWHLGNTGEFSPNAQGFDESLLMTGGLYLPEDDPGVVNARLEFSHVDQFIWASMHFTGSFNGGAVFRPPGYITDWWTDESVAVVEANKNRPFFLYLAHWAVHNPLQAAREDYEYFAHITPHRDRVYAAMIRSLDRSVGRILDSLRKQGLDENTLVVFVSDNGGAQYIGIDGINDPHRGWKGTFFEGGIRTPFFLRWPAAIKGGQVNAQPASQVDLLPTFVLAAGGSQPQDREIDGINLLDPTARRNDDAIYWQGAYYHAVRRGDWKLQVNHKQNKSWLHNIVRDPGERHNLVEQEPVIFEELNALLKRHVASSRPPLYPYTLDSPVPIDKTAAETYGPHDEFVYWPN